MRKTVQSKLLAAMMFCILLGVLVGCGGGGGGGGGAPATPTSVGGVVAKGIVNGAKVLVCRVNNGTLEADSSCATGTTGADGSYTVTLSDGWTGPVIVKAVGASGSTMFDEITGTSTSSYAMTMQAVVPAVGAATTVHVTPFSNMAAAAVGTSGVTSDVMKSAMYTVQSSLGVDLSTKPILDLKNSSTDSTTLGKQASMVKQLAKVIAASKDATASGLGCASQSDPVACGVGQLAGVMKGASTLDAAKANSVFTAWNSQTVTSVNIPVLKSDGTVTKITADLSSATSIASALTSGGMGAADANAASTEIQTESQASDLNSGAQISNVLGSATGGTITVTTPPTTTLSALDQAKAMVNSLRTTFNYYTNTADTGFLDLQRQGIGTELGSVVVPNLDRTATRAIAFSNAIGLYEDAKAQLGNYLIRTDAAGTFYVRATGTAADVVYGRGNFLFCRTNSFAGTTPNITEVACGIARPDTFAYSPDAIVSGSIGAMGYFRVAVTPANSESYSYVAGKRQVAVTLNANNVPVVDVSASSTTIRLVAGPYNVDGTTNTLDDSCNSSLTASTATGYACVAYLGSGTLTITKTSGEPTALAWSGTLPPSNPSNAESIGFDTVALNATRTLQSGSTYRYALSGSVVATETASSGVTPDTAKTVSLSLDSGSYVDVNETAATTTAPGPSSVIAVNVLGTFATPANKFNGTLVAGSFASDADGQNYAPTSMKFTGSVSDTSSGGAGQFLTGKLEVGISNYGSYHSLQPESPTNYVQTMVTFIGTVAAPNEPVMQLVVSGSNGYNGASHKTVSLTTTYSYGSGISITGSGTLDTVTGVGSIALTNQDGIKVKLATNTETTITASDGSTLLGTIKSRGMVYFVDGTFASL